MEQRIALLSVGEYGDKIRKTVVEAVELIGRIERVVKLGDRVLTKPNRVNARHGESGNVIHFSLRAGAQTCTNYINSRRKDCVFLLSWNESEDENGGTKSAAVYCGFGFKKKIYGSRASSYRCESAR